MIRKPRIMNQSILQFIRAEHSIAAVRASSSSRHTRNRCIATCRERGVAVAPLLHMLISHDLELELSG